MVGLSITGVFILFATSVPKYQGRKSWKGKGGNSLSTFKLKEGICRNFQSKNFAKLYHKYYGTSFLVTNCFWQVFKFLGKCLNLFKGYPEQHDPFLCSKSVCFLASGLRLYPILGKGRSQADAVFSCWCGHGCFSFTRLDLSIHLQFLQNDCSL